MNGYPDDYWETSDNLRRMWRDSDLTPPAPGPSIVALTVAATLIGVAGFALVVWLVWA